MGLLILGYQKSYSPLGLVPLLLGINVDLTPFIQASNLSKLLEIFSSILSLKDAIRKPSSNFMLSWVAVTHK